MSITKEGMVVGVKEKNEERYVGETQRYVQFFFLEMLVLCGGWGRWREGEGLKKKRRRRRRMRRRKKEEEGEEGLGG